MIITMNNEIKIVFTGSVGAGKTTAISNISEIPVINTDISTHDLSSTILHDVYANSSSQLLTPYQEAMTVAMDYGELTLPDGQKLRLYGTPGQQRFDYMWKILIKGALGLIVLVDNAGSDPIGDMARYIDNFRDFIHQTSAVIGITKMDIAPQPNLSIYYQYLQEHHIQLPIFPVDARSKDSVVMLIQSLVAMLEFGR